MSHRPGASGAAIVFVKRRLLLPLTRWLFEYTLENFRVQDRVNLALMSCLQSLAADHARLQLRLARLEDAPAGARSSRSRRRPSMKLACVVHRYGPQATGGSEAHCRAIAHRLAPRHDVTVLTSCAIDYVTWAQRAAAGPSRRTGRSRCCDSPSIVRAT